MTNVRVAVIGAGYWGRNLVRNFARLGALRAICDSNAEVRDRLGAAHPEARTYADPEAIFADPAIDAVAIATPAVTHGALARAALAAGKHAFVEKPLCLDLAEGPRLAAAARARRLTLMVGHVLLYHPAFVALAETVRHGTLGELRYLYSNRLSLGKIRREENALWSFAPHDISMMLALTGQVPRRVTAGGGTYLSPTVADTTLSYMEFENGLQGHIFVSWLHPYKDHRMVIIGGEAMAEFHDSVAGPDKLRLYRHQVGWNGEIPEVNCADAEPIPYGTDEPLALECQHFLDCVVHGGTPRSDAAEGLRVLAVLDACQQSLVGGAPVAVKVPT